MQLSQDRKVKLMPLLMITCATIFISTSGIFARYMQLPPPFVIWARCVIASVVLTLILWRSTSAKARLIVNKEAIVSGVLMCVHWTLFFYSLEYSSVAIAAVSVFTYPMITLLLESVLGKVKFDGLNILLSLLVVIGVYLLSPEFSLEQDVTWGVIFGVLSAAAYAVRNILSVSLVKTHRPDNLYLTQLVITAILLIPFSGSVGLQDIVRNIWPLLGLGLVTTVMGHLLLMKSFKHFTAGQSGLLASSQPIYAIILAVIFLGEIPSGSVIIGGLLILLSVVTSFLRALR